MSCELCQTAPKFSDEGLFSWCLTLPRLGLATP
jgi:hypothetical protein